ncbi:TRAP transporter large permease [Desulfothermus okinawensis JCM 13304]
MDFVTCGILGIIILLILFFLQIPVAYALALVGVVGYGILTSPAAALNLLSRDLYGVFSSYGLALVPLFIFMGFIAFYAGVSQRLYDMAYKLTSGVRGGLAMGTIVACTAFGAVCGSTTATAATIGSIAIPEMKRYGYGNKISAGSVAAGSGLGILMPPSVVFIIYGILTQVSIGKLFLAGIIPAILITILFCIAIYFYSILSPSQSPRGEKFPIKEKIKSIKDVWETMLIFSLVMGGMFFGLFTPTRAGAVGSFLLLVIVVIQKKLSWKNFVKAVNDTLNVSCMVIMLVAGATIFGHFLALSRISMEMANFVNSLNLPAWGIVSMICLIYLVAGCFIDALALVTLTIPIFFPIIINLGYDPIWFGVIIVLITQMGIITPPVGVNAYIVKGLSPHIKLEEVFAGIIPFLLALIVGTGIIIAFPKISLFLPDMVK